MIPGTWVPRRGDDGEVVGWIDKTVAERALVSTYRLGLSVGPGRRLAGCGAGPRIAHVYDDRIVLTDAWTTNAVVSPVQRSFAPPPV